MPDKSYVKFCQALFTHLSNVHLYDDFSLDNFIIHHRHKSPSNYVPIFRCEFCLRQFEGAKWLENHIMSSHKIMLDSPHLHFSFKYPRSINKVIQPKRKCKNGPSTKLRLNRNTVSTETDNPLNL